MEVQASIQLFIHLSLLFYNENNDDFIVNKNT